MLDQITARATAAVIATVSLVTGTACSQAAPQSPELSAKWKSATLYDMKVRTLEGKDANLSEYSGKVTLVVNVASRCGLTPQYAGLQKLYDKYKDQGLVILAFPSGDFGGQEFNDAKQIRDFCSTKYSVTFPVFEKCKVSSGKDQSPVFECLGTKTGELPGWNFGKYVVTRDGKGATFFASNTAPDSAKLVEAIEKALAEKAPVSTSPAPGTSSPASPRKDA